MFIGKNPKWNHEFAKISFFLKNIMVFKKLGSHKGNSKSFQGMCPLFGFTEAINYFCRVYGLAVWPEPLEGVPDCPVANRVLDPAAGGLGKVDPVDLVVEPQGLLWLQDRLHLPVLRDLKFPCHFGCSRFWPTSFYVCSQGGKSEESVSTQSYGFVHPIHPSTLFIWVLSDDDKTKIISVVPIPDLKPIVLIPVVRINIALLFYCSN